MSSLLSIRRIILAPFINVVPMKTMTMKAGVSVGTIVGVVASISVCNLAFAFLLKFYQHDKFSRKYVVISGKYYWSSAGGFVL